jgi:hypothetical protein
MDEKKVVIPTNTIFCCLDSLLKRVSSKKATDESIMGCKILDTCFAALYRKLSSFTSSSGFVMFIFYLQYEKSNIDSGRERRFCY